MVLQLFSHLSTADLAEHVDDEDLAVAAKPVTAALKNAFLEQLGLDAKCSARRGGWTLQNAKVRRMADHERDLKYLDLYSFFAPCHPKQRTWADVRPAEDTGEPESQVAHLVSDDDSSDGEMADEPEVEYYLDEREGLHAMVA